MAVRLCGHGLGRPAKAGTQCFVSAVVYILRGGWHLDLHGSTGQRPAAVCRGWSIWEHVRHSGIISMWGIDPK